MKKEDPMTDEKMIDSFVIYRRFDRPGKFIAHALGTNQTGIGLDMEEAIYELVKAFRTVMEESGSIEIRLAPSNVFSVFWKARRVPNIVMRRAMRRTPDMPLTGKGIKLECPYRGEISVSDLQE